MTAGAFIGRGELLDALESARYQAASGIPGVVWIDGAPGVGKTSLLRQFARRIDDADLIWVTADEDESRRPGGVLADLLHRLDPDHARSDAPTGSSDDHGRLLLDTLTRHHRGVVVVVDDLGWVDPSSLAALRFALRRLESERVLVVCTTDPDGEQTLGDTWQRWLRDPHLVTHLHVDGLRAEEIVELAESRGAGRLDDATAERLRRHTDGNALHLIALLTEFGADGLVESGPVLPSPRSFAELTRARLAVLDDPTRTLVEAGAVLGASFRVADAAAVAAVADHADAIDAATRVGLVRSPAAGLATFEHPLVRGAVYADLAPTRRRALHRTAATRTTGVASLTHRVEATDRPDDDLAAEIEGVARAETDAGDRSRGAELLLLAARVTASPEVRDQLIVCAAEAFIADGRLARALTLAPRVTACAHSAHRDHVLALFDTRQGRLTAGRARFLAAADAAAGTWCESSAAGTRSGDVRSRALAGAAFIDWFTGDAEHALDRATEALAGDVGWGGALMCYVRAMSLVHLGRFDELETHPLPERLPEALGSVDRLAVTGTVHLYRDDLAAAATDLAAAVELGRHATDSQLFAMALSLLAEVELRRGRWDAARIDADLAITFATDVSGVHALIQAQTVVAEVDALQGRFDDAEAHLAAADAHAGVLPAWGARARIAVAGAALAIARGDVQALVDAGAELTGGDLADIVGAFPGWRWRATVAEAFLADGNLEAAERVTDRLARILDDRGPAQTSPGAVASLARLRAGIARARGDDEAALAEYGRVAARHRGDDPLPVARALMDQGELLLDTGEAPEAVGVLESAERILARLGAVPFQDRCHELLERCGVEIALARPDPLRALTPRQESVALLVAENLTNKEIAAELIVGLKTVEYHLSQIFTKLDLHSRRDLAALVHQRRSAPRRR